MNEPGYYWGRVEETIVQAGQMKNFEGRQAMLELSKWYARLAVIAENEKVLRTGFEIIIR